MKIGKYILFICNIFIIMVSYYILYISRIDTVLKVLLSIILILSFILNIVNYLYFRNQFIALISEICKYSDDIMVGDFSTEIRNKETLLSKVVMNMEKMKRATQFQVEEIKIEKKELQEMISDISHQIKTPISNINMYCEMIDFTNKEDIEYKHYLNIIKQQVTKIDFLLESLIKASRLEREMINLKISNKKIIDTIVISVENIINKADKKKIEISVNCEDSIKAYHDMKWTAEAIENILDNAIKYTPKGGKIYITVHKGEMYIEIKIKDTGIGIEDKNINNIFKRFYRCENISNIDGVGLGLYLSRNIISLQSGYITVDSSIGKGSCFSIYLPTYK